LKQGGGRLRLKAKDRDFLVTFYEKCVEAGLRPSLNNREVEVYSIPLVMMLKQQRWRNFNTTKEKAEFLKGFFDGDGLALLPAYVNKDKDLLETSQRYLSDLGIRTSPIHEFWTGRTLVYIIDIHPDDYGAFKEKIRTSIKRKQCLLKLSEAVLRKPRTGDIGVSGGRPSTSSEEA